MPNDFKIAEMKIGSKKPRARVMNIGSMDKKNAIRVRDSLTDDFGKKFSFIIVKK